MNKWLNTSLHGKNTGTVVLVTLLTLTLASCSSGPKKNTSRIHSPEPLIEVAQENLPTVALAEKAPIQMPLPIKEEATYNFKAQQMPVKDAMAMFAKAYQRSVIIDPDVRGTVDVQFSGLTFSQAMDALLGSLGLYWEERGHMLHVSEYRTRTFQLNYIRMRRGGSGSSQASVTSSGSGGKVGAMSISNQDQVQFWAELEGQLKSMLSKTGRLVINRLSGTIQVNDKHRHIVEIEQFIEDMQTALHRQVEIEARIVEVTLSDDKNLGVDWSRVASTGVLNLDGALSTSLATAAAGTVPSITATLTGQTNGKTGQVSTIINALKEQGEVNVLSQPKLLVLNNQSAMIKVGTDQPFFSQTTTPGTGGSAPTVTEEVRVVTVGLVLAVTTQISNNGWVMLDAAPIITRLSGTVTSSLGSTAPVLDIKQTSTLVRLKDGETVMIGGLIQNENSNNDRQVPLMGELPFIGGLFSGTYQQKKRSELVIFLTPRIVDSKGSGTAL